MSTSWQRSVRIALSVGRVGARMTGGAVEQHRLRNEHKRTASRGVRACVAHLNLVTRIHAASSFLEHLPAAAFSSAGLAHDEVAVSNSQKLVQLRYL